MNNGRQKASHFAIYVITLEIQKMKLTESKIKEIILEEIQNIFLEQEGEQEKPQGEPQQKIQSDVQMIMKIMPRIDTYVEYQELLSAVLKHDFGDEARKKTILMKAQKEILKMIQGM